MIEILFQESLLKVLFATETFSIGLNMPAKTVVFTSVRKFDGMEQRWLSSGEYIQMSGRAGRRGLDTRGIVILMLDEKMEPAVAKNMLKGEANALDSAFYLTYSMILNMIRVEGAVPEMILEKSFYQFQTCAKIPELERGMFALSFILDLGILEKRRAGIVIENEEQVATYYDLGRQLEQYHRDVRDVTTNPSFILPFLQEGRLFKIVVDGTPITTTYEGKEEVTLGKSMNFGWGILISHQKRIPKEKGFNLSEPAEGPAHVLDMLLYCAPGTEANNLAPRPCPLDSEERGDMVVVPCQLSSVDAISSIKVFAPNNIKSKDQRTAMHLVLTEVGKRFGADIPLLDPVTDMGIRDEGFSKLIKVYVMSLT